MKKNIFIYCVRFQAGGWARKISSLTGALGYYKILKKEKYEKTNNNVQ